MAYPSQVGPLAIAHRGGAGLAPENTLAAFARSTALGFRYLETDVRITADGQLACFHDETVNRVTSRRGPVRAFTMAELRRLGVGGEPVVTLSEALEAFPDSRFTVDLKEAAAIEPLARVLARRDVGERVCVAGAWDGWLRRLRELAPHAHTALGWRSLTTLISCARVGVPAPRWVRTAEFAHVPVSLGRVPVFVDRLVDKAHAHGIRVIVWTVDEPVLMGRLLGAGVDGIITDRPDVLRESWIQRGIWQPMPNRPSAPTGVELDRSADGRVRSGPAPR
ncbi:glycerophosphoryl diester phosphodiesterase [Knoellia remsis]|uniref:Glycerophosphoryl diester phosphodiesterase n=1 Tax=Knoellia remsis TaxID=407159 RepID=A0A2T0UNG2_9MICO|nr:glycerophosphodiester phosphodiesterase [Knoellia remsis]PRY59469.1 glycerophosphoryl diester phosphodiesterase [Knoellia remsis]